MLRLKGSPRWGGRLKRLAVFVSVFTLVAYLGLCDLGTDGFATSTPSPLTRLRLDNVTSTAKRYADSAVQSPYEGQFWEVGQRSRRLIEWLGYLDEVRKPSAARTELVAAIETAATALFPFIRSPKKPRSPTPLADLRASFGKGERGIVMSVGGRRESMRFAGHLIFQLRHILNCTLPIQITYAGEDDLPRAQRDSLASLDPTNNMEFLDVLTVLDDSTTQLQGAGWAIKSFSALVSRFEQVIALDSDVVFLQDPEVLFEQDPFLRTGAYLFHDRLMAKGGFPKRLEFWRDQIKEPSPQMAKSLPFTQDYGEECDSGVVVLDKSRAAVLVGLLHTAWQNTRQVRDEVSYKIFHGDKETWWLGQELAGAEYEFEQGYAGVIGWETDDGQDDLSTNHVCGFTIAHVDTKGDLLWYNGSLLKNKLVDVERYEVPEVWMIGGTWAKFDPRGLSCMTGAETTRLTVAQRAVLTRAVDAAKEVVDQMFKEDKEL